MELFFNQEIILFYLDTPIKNYDEPSRTVVVRLERIDFCLHDEQRNKSILAIFF